MNFRELAEFTRVPRRTLYVLAANQSETGFPAYRTGREWRADLSEVMEWLIERNRRGEDMGLVARRLRRKEIHTRRLLN